MNWSKNIKEGVTKSTAFFAKYKSVILFFLVIILVFVVIFLWRKPQKVVVTNVENKDLIQEVKTLKDANNKSWSTLQALILDKEEAEARAKVLAAALKIKPKFVQGAEQWHVKTDTIFNDLKTTIIHDTIYSVEKHDAYVDITAFAGKNTGSIQYKSRDTLNILHVVKNPLIGRTTRTTYISSSNPYNTIVSGYSYTVKEKKAYISVGPIVGYDIITRKPTVGIGVMFPIINFKR